MKVTLIKVPLLRRAFFIIALDAKSDAIFVSYVTRAKR